MGLAECNHHVEDMRESGAPGLEMSSHTDRLDLERDIMRTRRQRNRNPVIMLCVEVINRESAENPATATYQVLDHFNSSFHRLHLGKQFILFSVAFFEEIVDANLVCESGAVVEYVLNGLLLH